MKFVVIILTLSVIGIFLYQRTAGITMSLIEDCHKQAQGQLQISNTTGRITCVHNKKTLEQMSVCLETVQKEKSLAGLLYEFSGTKDKIKVTILSHNTLCDDEQVPIPTAELYLQ